MVIFLGISLYWSARLHLRFLCQSSVHLNDLSNNISSSANLFADDRFLFSVVDNINVSMVQLINNLEKILMWAVKRRCLLILASQNKPKRYCFLRKAINLHILLFFNNVLELWVTKLKKAL